MRPVERRDIVDYITYQETRAAHRQRVMALKMPRRIHVGTYLTFLFENHDTIRYQIQEMMLAEHMVREADIRHELDTYNEVLGGDGELGATLLIEIESAEERAVKLRQWLDLPRRLYARLEDDTLVRPSFDARQVGEERLSSVHYLKFATGGRVPVSLGCDHPDLSVEVALGLEQRAALAEDLAGGASAK